MINLRPQRSAIGLDVGPRTIAAVQACRARSQWRIEAAAVVTRPAGCKAAPERDELLRLQDILYRRGFAGRDVVLAVPDAKLLSGTIELPPAASGAPLEQLARAELARMHRRDPDSLEIVSWRIPAPMRAGNGTYMMAVGCLREEIERALDAFESAGFSPAAVDARAWAMARAVEPLLEASTHASAILDMGDSEAILSVVHSGTVVYERLMADSGIATLVQKLRTDLRLEAEVADYVLQSVGLSGNENQPDGESSAKLAEAAAAIREYFAGLLQEFRTALAYATHRYPGEVERVFVHGAGASIPGLMEFMAADLGVWIQVPTLAELAHCSEGVRDQCTDPALTTALGLAIHPGVAA